MKNSTAYRAALGVAAAATFILLWANGAVGLIGNENNPANLLYFGVIAVALVGTFLARFRPRGMMYTMVATALVQFLVPVVAMLIFRPPVHSPAALRGILWVFALNAVFAALFAASALLFRRAAALSPRQEPPERPGTLGQAPHRGQLKK